MEKKVDPGWNDPPMLNYNASNPPPKSRIANKRIAFPLNSNSPTKSLTTSSINTSPIALIPPLTIPTLTNIPGQILNPSPDVLNDSLNPVILNTAVELSNFIKYEEDKQILLDFWKENKFSSSCIEHIELLCKYLKAKDKENVIKMKAKLLSEYKDSCDLWIRSIEG